MREILFRGKRIDNGEWVYGYVEPYILSDRIQMCYISVWGERMNQVIPDTVGQYTGLKDKNGKRIFEGDIVDCSKEWWDAYGFAGHSTPILQVAWDDRTCGFEPFSVYDCDCGVFIEASGCEVIGNIHDNPELLEVEHE